MASSAVLSILLLALSVSGSLASNYRSSPANDWYGNYAKSPNPQAPAKPLPRGPVSAPSNMAAQFMGPQNDARARLGLPPLRWDSNLEGYARWWAGQRKAYGNCGLQHSSGPYGENIFWGSGKDWSPLEAATAWVDEAPYYDYQRNTCIGGQDCGHYTQIVWRGTTRIGCAKATCADGNIFITCNYDPPGNYIGERPY